MPFVDGFAPIAFTANHSDPSAVAERTPVEELLRSTAVRAPDRQGGIGGFDLLVDQLLCFSPAVVLCREEDKVITCW